MNANWIIPIPIRDNVQRESLEDRAKRIALELRTMELHSAARMVEMELALLEWESRETRHA